MKLDTFLYKKSFHGFILFFLFTIWAFWPTYFSHPVHQPDIRFHLHGIIMTLWCLLLIMQAYLIRTNRKEIHRQTGKISYVLVPLIIFITINLLHFREQAIKPPDVKHYELALVLNALVVFVIIYGLAMYNRKRPLVHARYMVCTVFPLFTPVTDRLIHHHFRPLMQFVPWIDGEPVVPVIGFAMADILLIILVFWDWKANRRRDVFPVSLALLLVYHISVVTFYRFQFWNSFGDWFLRLPLS